MRLPWPPPLMSHSGILFMSNLAKKSSLFFRKILLLFPVFAFQINAYSEIKNSLEGYNLNGNIKQVKMTYNSSHNKFDINRPDQEIFYFNRQGFLVNSTRFIKTGSNNHEMISYTTYIYNDKKHLIKSIKYDGNRRVTTLTKYSLDKDGRITRNDTSENGKPYDYSIYSYDSAGNVSDLQTYSDDNPKKNVAIKNIYNINNKLTYQKIEANELVINIYNRYNNQGFLIKTSVKSAFPNVEISGYSTFEYGKPDSHGNWLKLTEKTFYDGKYKNDTSVMREIIYYSDQ